MSVFAAPALLILATPAAAEITPPVQQTAPVEQQAPTAPPTTDAPSAADAPSTTDTTPAPQSLNNSPPQGNEIIVSQDRQGPPGDPLLKLNAQSYEISQKVDDAFVAPMAKGYKDILPKPVRSGLRHFLRNLKEPVIALNFLLQFKPGKAAETLARFAINSTVGIAGLIDVADDKGINLPYRPNGFADTLGYYGVKPGPYFFLPLLGPTTLRDFIGFTVDSSILPSVVGGPFADPKFTIPEIVINSLDSRVQFDDELSAQRASSDPYTAAREHYLKMRQAEIDGLHGRSPVDPSSIATPPPSPPAVVAAPATDVPPPAEPAAGAPASAVQP